MARPIKVIPTLEGEAAVTFLKRADAVKNHESDPSVLGRKKRSTLHD